MISKIKDLLGIKNNKQDSNFIEFRDGLGNFKLMHPREWKYEPEMVYYEGQYSICFEGREGVKFCVSLEPFEKGDFLKLGKAKLEDQKSSGIGNVREGRFKDEVCLVKEFITKSGKNKIKGKTLLVAKHKKLIEISEYWPEKNENAHRKTLDKVEESVDF